jgi:hypothetical protein
MAVQLVAKRGFQTNQPGWLSGYKVRSIDASAISEPGSTGTDWRLHYSLELFRLSCDQFILTQLEVGESFTNFKVAPGDLLLGDRAYGTLKGLWHVKNNGGDCLVRLKSKAFPMCDHSGKPFRLLQALRKLKVGEVGEWAVQARANGYPSLPIRICGVKKSREAAEEAIARATSEMKKQQASLDEDTLELHRYVLLATFLAKEKMSATQVAQLYRTRWQIEVAFKRLKSIMGLGHLPKVDIDSARAWLHGKVFVALLVQAIIDEGRFFSPWGYPLRET